MTDTHDTQAISVHINSFAFVICFTSCSSTANLVVSNSANLSKYKYVSFGKEQTGDRELDDVMLLVQNEIANTKLQSISLTYALMII